MAASTALLGFCLAHATELSAADVLQCVPYAREISGVDIHGDAWTWWDKAKGVYKRGHSPKVGAVLALANSDVMPLGHVAVVSDIVDDRHIRLRHANWSGPGMIERDVLAVDTSDENDWSQVRIWWGQTQQMGARNNLVNGFIYPSAVSKRAIYADAGDDMPSAPRTKFARSSDRVMLSDSDDADQIGKKPHRPLLKLDLAGLFGEPKHGKSRVEAGKSVKTPPAASTMARADDRTLADIIADVKTRAKLL